MNLPSPTDKNQATFSSEKRESPKEESALDMEKEDIKREKENEVRQAQQREIFTSRRDNSRPKQQWGLLISCHNYIMFVISCLLISCLHHVTIIGSHLLAYIIIYVMSSSCHNYRQPSFSLFKLTRFEKSYR